MPEVHFTVELPDGAQRLCYSPSSIVHQFFKIGEMMSVAEFQKRSRTALKEASERVRAKFGFACTAATMQLETIEQFTSAYPGSGMVRIIDI